MAAVIFDHVLEIIEHVVDDIVNDLLLEMDLIEELLLEPDDDERENANDAANVLDHNVGRVVLRFIELAVRDIEYFDDEEDFCLEDDRQVLDGQFRALSVDRFKQLDDVHFAQHFRMNRQVFQALIDEIGNHLVAHNRLLRLRTGLDKCLLMALWVLGNLSSFRGTAAVFGTSRSVVHFHYLVVIEALRELASKFIKWPGVNERNRTKARIRRKSGYPGIIGMMDGMLITVTAPKVQRERYFDRHHNYSYNVLFICDDTLKLIHVYVGEAGSVHDSRVFQRSPISTILLERPNFLGDDEHLVADGAYTLTSKVLVPYRDNGRLTPRQRNFNFIHSSNRMPIEKVNGGVKEKWRRLYRFHVKNADYALDHIMACAVLHNFVLLGGREPDGLEVVAPIQQNNPVNGQVGQEHPLMQAARIAGAQKRDDIALRLLPDDAV